MELFNLKDDLGETMVEEIEETVERSTAQKKDADQRRPAPAPKRSAKVPDTLPEVLDTMRDRLEEYPSIEEDLRQDLLVDVDTLYIQLRRKNINPNSVLALLEPFAEVDFVGDLVARVRQLALEASDSDPA